MVVFIMDRNFQTLKEYERLLEKIDAAIQCRCYTSSSQLLQAAEEPPPDVIFLEYEEKNAVLAMEKLQKAGCDAGLILASETGEFSAELCRLNLSGVLIKPLTEEKLRSQLQNLRHKGTIQTVFDSLLAKQAEKRKEIGR